MAAAFECGSVLNVKFNKGSLEISHKHFCHFHSILSKQSKLLSSLLLLDGAKCSSVVSTVVLLSCSFM